MGIVVVCTWAVLLAMKGQWFMAYALFVIAAVLAVVYERDRTRTRDDQFRRLETLLKRLEGK